jgi:hypothetical protein
MNDIDNDQQAEHLRQKIARLEYALLTIDKDVDRAAAKYLRPVVEYGHLKFCKFVDLLAAEMKRRAKEELKDERKIQNVLTREIERRMEERITALLPAIKGKLSDYLTMQVLILNEHKIPVHEGHVTRYKTACRAFVIRGNIKHYDGGSPEEAYAHLREQITIELFQTTPETMFHRLAVKDMELSKRFSEAEPFKTDDIGGYKIEVRII